MNGGKALDVACGFGGNAMFLADHGYSVDAVDISPVALRRARREARKRGLSIHFVQSDLHHYYVAPNHYDVIVIFYYLNRSLMPSLAAGLRQGGLLFQSNRNRRFLVQRPEFDPDYLLELGELYQLALRAGLEIIHYTDGTSNEPHSTQLIARRPR